MSIEGEEERERRKGMGSVGASVGVWRRRRWRVSSGILA